MTLRYLTAGESHGKGLTAVLEGMPSHVPLLLSDIDCELKRRQQGYGRGARMKIETDAVEITAGVRHGETLGSPISLWIANRDHQAWQEEMAVEEIQGFKSKKKVHHPRPGHADLSGGIKYDQKDLRNVLERASARETAARVAVGAICKKFLKEFEIQVTAHVIQIGGVKVLDERPDFHAIQKAQESNPCRCLDPIVSKAMMREIDKAKSQGDSVGGIFEVLVRGVPAGLGSHVQWDRKLEARLAQSVLSIQAIKGVEFGMGFGLGRVFGSEAHDGICYDQKNQSFGRRTNRAGGFEGGITTGENIVIRAVMKPIATLMTPLESVDLDTKTSFKASVERSDTCAVPAASVIAENVICFDIAGAMLDKFGGDSLGEVKRNYAGYVEYLKGY